jgi:O-antigen/teichoic acid export membrane protein
MVLTALLASSLPQILTRYFWEKSVEVSQKGIFFMTMVTQVAVSILLCALLIPLSGFFSEIIIGSPDWKKVITLVILSSGLQAINNIINTLMRLQSRAVLYISANIFKLVMVLLITVFLIIKKGAGLEGIYLAQVIGNLIFILILSGYTITNSAPAFSWRLLREMNIYGYPLLIANISAVALTVIDRYSLNSMAVMKYVAIYTLAFKVSSVLKLVIVDSIKLSVAPMIFRKADSPDAKRFYSKVLLYTSFVVMLGVLFISLFSYEIIKVLARSKELWNAVYIIPVLSISIFFVNMKEVTVYALHIARKTKIIGSIVIVTTIVSLGLNLLLIPVWDITGCAVATLLSQLFYSAAVLFYSQKNYHIPYEYKKLALLFLTGILFSFSSLLLNNLELFPRVSLKIIVFAGFPFLLYILRFYEDVEIMAIRGFLRKWGNPLMLRENLRSLKNITDIKD